MAVLSQRSRSTSPTLHISRRYSSTASSSSSPTLYRSPSTNRSAQFFSDRNRQFGSSSSASPRISRPVPVAAKKTCVCSPPPGTYRCSLHRNQRRSNHSASRPRTDSNMILRSAMRNSLMRIVSREGDFAMKRALANFVKPSLSNQQQRARAAFKPRPSRLSVMSNAVVEDS